MLGECSVMLIVRRQIVVSAIGVVDESRPKRNLKDLFALTERDPFHGQDSNTNDAVILYNIRPLSCDI